MTKGEATMLIAGAVLALLVLAYIVLFAVYSVRELMRKGMEANHWIAIGFAAIVSAAILLL